MRKIIRAINEISSDYTKLQSSIRKKINKDLSPKEVGTYFERIPLKLIEKILGNYDLILLQEDGTEFEGFFTGDSGRCTIDIGYRSSQKEDRYCTTYTSIENSVLVLMWYKMDSGNYEITCYVS